MHGLQLVLSTKGHKLRTLLQFVHFFLHFHTTFFFDTCSNVLFRHLESRLLANGPGKHRFLFGWMCLLLCQPIIFYFICSILLCLLTLVGSSFLWTNAWFLPSVMHRVTLFLQNASIDCILISTGKYWY